MRRRPHPGLPPRRQVDGRLRGIPTLRQAFVPQPVVGRTPAGTPRLYRGDRADLRPAVHAGSAGGLVPPARRGRPRGRNLRAHHTAAPPARHQGEPPEAFRRESLDRFHAVRVADRGTGRGDAQGHEPAAGQGRRQHARRQFPRGLGVHGRKSCGQRGDGRRNSEISPGHSRARRDEHHLEAGQHHLDDCLSVVNGPIRNEIGMNAGSARSVPIAMPTRRSGGPIGCCRRISRAGRCRAKPIWARSAIRSHTACVSRNQERSPWLPLHVQKGLKPADSAVSVFVALTLHPGRVRAPRHLGGKCRRCLAATALFAA